MDCAFGLFSDHGFLSFQLIQKYEIEVTFRKKYNGPYFHLHTENPFIKIISETYIDTRSKNAHFFILYLQDTLIQVIGFMCIKIMDMTLFITTRGVQKVRGKVLPNL